MQTERRLVPPPSELGGWLARLQDEARKTESLASEKLKGKKVQPPPPALQSALDGAVGYASKVADVKLVGGGEIIERAVSALVDNVRNAEPRGVFATVRAMSVEISRLTELAKRASTGEEVASPQEPVAPSRSTTLRHSPGRGLVPSDKEPTGPAVVVKKTGAEVAGVGNYAEIVAAIRKAMATFGPLLARAIHDVPVGPINASMDVIVRGREITKDQDKFLSEVALLVRIEMMRATSAWAFLVPELIAAKTAAGAADAFASTVFPHAQAGFVAQYAKWGPRVFDTASSALFDRLGADFKNKEGLNDGDQLFLKPDEIQNAVGVVKAKLKVAYDHALTNA